MDELISFIKEQIYKNGEPDMFNKIALDSNAVDRVAEKIARQANFLKVKYTIEPQTNAILQGKCNKCFDRVRKETAKEIFEQLAKDELMQYENFGIADLKKYAEQYGVEL